MKKIIVWLKGVVWKCCDFYFFTFRNKCLFCVTILYISERSWVWVCYFIRRSLLVNTKLLAAKSQTFHFYYFFLKAKAIRQIKGKILLNIFRQICFQICKLYIFRKIFSWGCKSLRNQLLFTKINKDIRF